MIKRTILRLLGAGVLGLLGLGFLAGDTDNVFAMGMIVVAFLWGTVEMFILSAQLLMYGLSGIIHDLDQSQRHDPWNRW